MEHFDVRPKAAAEAELRSGVGRWKERNPKYKSYYATKSHLPAELARELEQRQSAAGATTLSAPAEPKANGNRQERQAFAQLRQTLEYKVVATHEIRRADFVEGVRLAVRGQSLGGRRGGRRRRRWPGAAGASATAGGWRAPPGAAGLVDPGEQPIETARRELAEETGYLAAHLERLVQFYTSPGFCTEHLHIFVATTLEACAAAPDDDEDIELVRMPFDEAIERVLTGEISDAKTVAGLLAYRRRKLPPQA